MPVITKATVGRANLLITQDPLHSLALTNYAPFRASDRAVSESATFQSRGEEAEEAAEMVHKEKRMVTGRQMSKSRLGEESAVSHSDTGYRESSAAPC
ncbi:hypothetical protein AOLI_G00239080 [Acnodon oligacanthus]